jgi:putative flippase GtrA
VRTGTEDNLTASFCVLLRRASASHGRKGEGARPESVFRWLKFNLVGGFGIAVQLPALLVLKSGLHLHYLLATALAVEAAVVHNFFWHERYTWADRVQPSWKKSLPRLLRFNLTTGAISIAGNMALMKGLVGLAHMNYLFASGVSIALCSVLNFLVSERWVFEPGAKIDRATLADRSE